MIALALAICGVILIIVFGLMGDGGIKTYLEKPGITGQFENKDAEQGTKDPESPLVTQAQAFALRIDPPPPPSPPVEQTPREPREEVKDVQREKVEPRVPTPPKPPMSTKFDLLATVLCKSNPSRSMVLLKLGSGAEEWYWQGEQVGHHVIDEVRDGSAVFSQDGRNSQELFVPAKPQTQSLLKADAAVSPRPSGGPGGIDIPSDAVSTVPPTISPTERHTSGPAARPNLSRAGSAARTSEAGRIQRLRTVPKVKTPQEEKASLEDSIQSIQGLMGREDDVLTEEQRKSENEAWAKLLSALQEEKEKLEPAVKAAETKAPEPQAEKESEESQSDEQTNDPNQE